MAQKTLMTPQSVTRHSPVKKLSIEQCSFSDIHSIEYMQARHYIGFDLWTSMLAAMADYSAVAEWTPGTTPMDELRKFNGVVYKALQETEEQPPALLHWIEAPIFDEAGACATDYENFFCDHLAPYLANTILFYRIPYMDAVEYKDKKVKRSDGDGIKRIYDAVSRDRAMIWGNILHFMRQDAQIQKQASGGCFEGWIGATDETCKIKKTPGTRQMRTGTYDFG